MTSRSLSKNVIWNLAGMVIPLVLMLVTTPLYIQLLGDARFGVLAIIWLLLNYLLFMDLGFGRAVANQLAKLPINEIAQRGRVFWTAISIVLALAITMVLTIIAAIPIISNQLLDDSNLKSEIIGTIPWVCVGLLGVLPSLVCIGALEGQQRFDISNLLHVSAVSLYQLLPLLIVWQANDDTALLTHIVMVGALVRVTMGVIHVLAAVKYAHISTTPMLNMATAKQLLNFGGPVALTSLLSPVLETVDRLVLGKLQGPVAVAHYTAGYQLIRAVRIFPIAISKALFPKFSQTETDSTTLSTQSQQVLLLFITPILVVALLFVEPFLGWWLNEIYQAKAGPVAKILLLGVWFNALAVIPYSQLQGQGKPGLVAKVHLAELLPYLLVLWILVQEYGAMGAAIAWLLRMVVDYAALAQLATSQGSCKTALYKSTALRLLLASAVLIVGSYGVTLLWPALTIIPRGGVAIMFIFSWFLGAYFAMPLLRMQLRLRFTIK